MTDEQKQLVQSSFQKLAPISGRAAAMFYRRLFELDPSLRPLFPSDLAEQGKKLMQMLGVAVRGLNSVEDLIPVVEALARRHAGYGVRPEHYDTVGAALVLMLEQALGDTFTVEVKEAWVEVYGIVASVMKYAAYPRRMEAHYG